MSDGPHGVYQDLLRLQDKVVLGREFEIKDYGQLKYFIGVEIARTWKGIWLPQRKYTLDLLTETTLTRM